MEPTEHQVKEFIHQSNLIEDINDPQEDEQSYIAWLIINGEPKKLTHGIICKVQKVITLHDERLSPGSRGYYRDLIGYEVQVGGYIAPSARMVPHLMDNWILDYADPTKDFDPKLAHIRFEAIHPFADGNGRTGRMVLNWHRLRKGMPLLIIPNETKYKDYYTWFAK